MWNNRGRRRLKTRTETPASPINANVRDRVPVAVGWLMVNRGRDRKPKNIPVPGNPSGRLGCSRSSSPMRMKREFPRFIQFPSSSHLQLHQDILGSISYLRTVTLLYFLVAVSYPLVSGYPRVTPSAPLFTLAEIKCFRFEFPSTIRPETERSLLRRS